jgi:hypothetical protein
MPKAPQFLPHEVRPRVLHAGVIRDPHIEGDETGTPAIGKGASPHYDPGARRSPDS